MKLTFGRKFWACLIALLLVSGLYLVTLRFVPNAIKVASLITYGVFIITICFAYVGGNVWNKWVRSKYFQADILNSDQK